MGATDLGRRVEQSDWIDHAVRFGLVVYGTVYVLIAVLAGRLAFGDYRGSVSKGAFTTVAEQPFGTWLLVVIAVGMGLLVAWRLLDAAVGHREEDGAERWRLRGADLVRGVVYAGVAWKALGTATGSSGGSPRATTAKLMDLPLGPWIVGAAGAGIAVFGATQVWRGLSEKHRENLAAEGRSGTAGAAYLLLGKIGYAAKGVAFVIIGALTGYAAVTHEPRKSGGLDAALYELLQQPFGSWLLLGLASGLGCYGLFSLARARHLSR